MAVMLLNRVCFFAVHMSVMLSNRVCFFAVHMSVMLLNRVCFSQYICRLCYWIEYVFRSASAFAVRKQSGNWMPWYAFLNIQVSTQVVPYTTVLIMSNFNHCPLLWHFCGQVRNQKKRSKEEVLEYCLPITIQELLEQAGTITLLIQQFLLIALTVFESLHVLTPECIKMIVHPFLCAISDAWLQFVRSITLQNHNI